MFGYGRRYVCFGLVCIHRQVPVVIGTCVVFRTLRVSIIRQLICPSVYLLHKALTERKPPIGVTIGVVKTWWQHCRSATKTEGISSAKDLHEQYGARIAPLVVSRSASLFSFFYPRSHTSEFGPACPCMTSYTHVQGDPPLSCPH